MNNDFSAKLKILLVAPLPPPVGGVSIWAKQYIDSKLSLDNDVYVVNTSKTALGAQNFGKNQLKEEFKRICYINRSLQIALNKSNFDIIHFNVSCSPIGIIRDFFFIRKMKGRAKKIIIHLHYDASQMVKGIFMKRFLKSICKLSDVILCLNQPSKKQIDQLSSKSSIIVPNFIDAGLFADLPARLFNERIKTVIYVGHVLKSKGFLEIIEAARQLPDIEFKIVGYADEATMLMHYPDNVKFLGEVSRKSVLKEMMESDLLLLPSYTEGFPIVILEAMLCGLPVIATPVGAIPEMIENKGGVMVNVGDAVGIINAIIRMHDINIRKKMSEWNYAKVMSCYTEENIVTKLIEIYRS